MFYKSNGKITDKNKIFEVLGEDFYVMTCLKLRTASNQIGHFSDILADAFLPIKFVRSITFSLNFLNDEKCSGFLSKKKVQVKNEVTRNLSSPIVEIFNGYEMIGQDLARNERVDIDPTNIVYEPVFDEHIPVPCFFHRQNLLGLQKLYWQV